jgi:hypothetical protein
MPRTWAIAVSYRSARASCGGAVIGGRSRRGVVPLSFLATSGELMTRQHAPAAVRARGFGGFTGYGAASSVAVHSEVS